MGTYQMKNKIGTDITPIINLAQKLEIPEWLYDDLVYALGAEAFEESDTIGYVDDCTVVGYDSWSEFSSNVSKILREAKHRQIVETELEPEVYELIFSLGDKEYTGVYGSSPNAKYVFDGLLDSLTVKEV